MLGLVSRRHRLDPSLEVEMAEWFSHCTFTFDQKFGQAAIWAELLRPLREKPAEALEIGTLEGRSAVFILGYLPQANITCIDSFVGMGGRKGGRRNFEDVEARFDDNVRPFADRVTKVKDHSVHALDALAQAGRLFDFIYVDASHRTDDVMLDSILAWRLLEVGGILIWDDYKFARRGPPEQRPQPAIEFFLRCHRDLEVVHFGWQVAVRKTAAARRGPLWLGGYKLLRKLKFV